MKSCIYDDSGNIVAYADNADKMKDGSFTCDQIKSCGFCVVDFATIMKMK